MAPQMHSHPEDDFDRNFYELDDPFVLWGSYSRMLDHLDDMSKFPVIETMFKHMEVRLMKTIHDAHANHCGDQATRELLQRAEVLQEALEEQRVKLENFKMRAFGPIRR
jgi:hypothetical protein